MAAPALQQPRTVSKVQGTHYILLSVWSENNSMSFTCTIVPRAPDYSIWGAPKSTDLSFTVLGVPVKLPYKLMQLQSNFWHSFWLWNTTYCIVIWDLHVHVPRALTSPRMLLYTFPVLIRSSSGCQESFPCCTSWHVNSATFTLIHVEFKRFGFRHYLFCLYSAKQNWLFLLLHIQHN